MEVASADPTGASCSRGRTRSYLATAWWRKAASLPRSSQHPRRREGGFFAITAASSLSASSKKDWTYAWRSQRRGRSGGGGVASIEVVQT